VNHRVQEVARYGSLRAHCVADRGYGQDCLDHPAAVERAVKFGRSGQVLFAGGLAALILTDRVDHVNDFN
jgi:hypothetical protein